MGGEGHKYLNGLQLYLLDEAKKFRGVTGVYQSLLRLRSRRDTYAAACAAASAACTRATSASTVVCGVQRQRRAPHLRPTVHR